MWLVYSLLAAICFGLRGILYQWSSQKPMDRNLMLFGVFFTGAIVSLIMIFATNQTWSTASLIGIAMGTFSFLANGAMYKGFAVGKASLIAILTSLPPLVVIGLAYLMWGETLNVWQLLSFLIILSGVIMIRYSSDFSLKNLQGLHWGLLAMLFFGMNDVSSKQSMLLGGDVFPTLFMMFSVGSLLFFLVWQNSYKRRALSLVDLPEKNSPPQWKKRNTFLWGMVVGLTNVSGMALILPAFAGGITGLVSAVIALNVLLILLYVRFFLKEKFRRLELIGMGFAFIGIIVLRLLG